MATNNLGDSLDSAGNVAVDFVWGNLPIQPDDERAATITQLSTGNVSGDHSWGATTQVASARLDMTLDNHGRVGTAYAGYPSYTPALGNFIVTGASGDGTTVTYQSQNFLAAGQTVNITGLNTSAFNLSNATVATAKAGSFTVTNSAGSGITITGQTGKVEPTNALDSGDGAGVGNIQVPNVLRLATASALDALLDRGFISGNITTASAFTPVISAITLASNVVSVTATAHGYKTGDVVTIAGLTNGSGSASLDADLNGTYTITAVSDANNFSFAKTHADITAHSGLSGNTAKVAALAGKVYSQSVAAGASNVAYGSSITITPYFAS